ncbi:MAG TPA: hypothetical protein V6C58_17400 [Allocoleopsis sp.]
MTLVIRKFFSQEEELLLKFLHSEKYTDTLVVNEIKGISISLTKKIKTLYIFYSDINFLKFTGNVLGILYVENTSINQLILPRNSSMIKIGHFSIIKNLISRRGDACFIIESSCKVIHSKIPVKILDKFKRRIVLDDVCSSKITRALKTSKIKCSVLQVNIHCISENWIYSPYRPKFINYSLYLKMV